MPTFCIKVRCNGQLHRIQYNGLALSFPDHANMHCALTLHELGGEQEYGCPEFLRLWRNWAWEKVKQPQLQRALRYCTNIRHYYRDVDEKLQGSPDYGVLNEPLEDRLETKLVRLAKNTFLACKYHINKLKYSHAYVYKQDAGDKNPPYADTSVRYRSTAVSLHLPLAWLTRVYTKGLGIYKRCFVLDVVCTADRGKQWARYGNYAVFYLVQQPDKTMRVHVEFLMSLQEWKK